MSEHKIREMQLPKTDAQGHTDFSQQPGHQFTTPPSDPLLFPWPEVRDFVSVLISQMLCQQSVLVGEKMLSSGAPGVTPEQLATVRAQAKELERITQALNEQIEQKLAEWQGARPRLLIAR